MTTQPAAAVALPLVSAVIPAYNSERYLARAIDSVLAQTYPNIECIVVDDGSTDATGRIIESYGARVRGIRQPNGGASAARNAGLAAAKGRYIAFLDSDDYWLDTKTANQVAVFQAYPGLVLVCCGFEWQAADGCGAAPISPGPAYRPDLLERFDDLAPLLLGPYLGTPSVMVDAETIRGIGGFDTGLPVAEDVDMYFRLCANRSYARLNQTLVHFQFRAGSLSKELRGYRDNLRVLDRLEHLLPEFAGAHAESFRAWRLEIYSWWVRDLLFRGQGRSARAALRESRRIGAIGKHRTLYLKSFIAPVISPLRRLRGHVQAWTK